MANFVSTWTDASTVPADTETPAQHCVSDQNTRNDIYKTLFVNMELTTGGFKKGTTANRTNATTGFPSPVATNVYFNTDTNVFEVYTGSAWRPIGYEVEEQLNAYTGSTSTQINFRLNSGTTLKYFPTISGEFTVVWTPSGNNTFLKLYSSTNSGFTGGTLRLTTPISGSTTVKPVTFGFAVNYNSLAVDELYWYVVASSGSDTFSTTTADSLMRSRIKGISVT